MKAEVVGLAAITVLLVDGLTAIMHGTALRWSDAIGFALDAMLVWLIISSLLRIRRRGQELNTLLGVAKRDVALRERLRLSTYGAAPVGVAVLDQDKRVLYANPKAKEILPRAEGLDSGRLTCREWFCTERTCRKCVLPRALGHRSVLGPSRLQRQSDGDTQYLELMALPLELVSEESNRAVVFIRDVTSEAILAGAARDEMVVYGLAMAGLIDMRDRYTGFHSRNVSIWSTEIARRLRLQKELIDRVKIAALLHDIGKIGVPESILCKEGKLSAEERRVMQRHPDIGADAIHSLRPFADIVPGIRFHHERVDGHGYPRGLRGDEIPLDARIIAAADVYDALITDRPYRKAFSAHDALGVLRSMRGTALDARVVDALVAIVKESPRRTLQNKVHFDKASVKDTSSRTTAAPHQGPHRRRRGPA